MHSLSDYIKPYRGKQAVWGESDCCLFALGWVEATTNQTLKRPMYNGKREALALIKQAGGLANLCDSVLSPVAYKSRYLPELGEIAIIKTAHHGDVAVIGAGHGTALWRTQNDVTIINITEKLCVCSWQYY